MGEPKEKTNTKTLEIKNAPGVIAGSEVSSPGRPLKEVTDPTLNANRSAIAKEEATRKVLLADALKKKEQREKEVDDELEFTAATAVIKMSPEMLMALKSAESSIVTPAPQATATSQTLSTNLVGLGEEEIKRVKIEVKKHYIKKARILEEEIGKILTSLKTNNPVIVQQFDRIRVLLGKHSGRIKDET